MWVSVPPHLWLLSLVPRESSVVDSESTHLNLRFQDGRVHTEWRQSPTFSPGRSVQSLFWPFLALPTHLLYWTSCLEFARFPAWATCCANANGKYLVSAHPGLGTAFMVAADGRSWFWKSVPVTRCDSSTAGGWMRKKQSDHCQLEYRPVWSSGKEWCNSW